MIVPPEPSVRLQRPLPWLLGLAALAPFIFLHRDFRDLFWYGDDFDLIRQMDQSGVWRWTWRVFAENTVPVFKLGWAGLIFLGGGSSFAAFSALWVTHAACVVLYGKILQRAECPSLAVVISAGMFGLSWTNHETLGWMTQWSAVLATVFTLGAIYWFLEQRAVAVPWSWRVHGGLMGLIALAAFSFSRGVLAGFVLAGASLAPWPDQKAPWTRRLAVSALCLAPSLAAGLVIAICSAGNHRALGSGHALEMLRYGAFYLAMNPFGRLLSPDLGAWGWHTAALLGAVKCAFIAWGLRHSTGRLRGLLGLLVLFELGDAALLGVGRFHTGLDTVLSSRYQYSALLGTLPFVAIGLDHALRRWISSAALRIAGAAVVILAAGWLSVRYWPAEMHRWAEDRGRLPRQALLGDRPSTMNPDDIHLPHMSFAEANELIARYHLH